MATAAPERPQEEVGLCLNPDNHTAEPKCVAILEGPGSLPLSQGRARHQGSGGSTEGSALGVRPGALTLTNSSDGEQLTSTTRASASVFVKWDNLATLF